MDSNHLRAEHDAVLAGLSARASTQHVAHAALGGLVSLIILGVAATLWWDFSEYHPLRYQVALVLSGLVALYALARAVIAARHFRRERAQLRRLRALRQTLGIDDPATLLPD